MFVGVTDYDWFTTLKEENCEEINFWKPSGKGTFRALKEGELFLFKLHSPNNFIVGGGFFLSFSRLPSSLAWEAFGIANGTRNLLELRIQIPKLVVSYYPPLSSGIKMIGFLFRMIGNRVLSRVKVMIHLNIMVKLYINRCNKT